MRDPRAVRAADWWERNQHRFNPDDVFYPDGYRLWTDGMDLTPEDDLWIYLDYCDIIAERRLYRGMARAESEAA